MSSTDVYKSNSSSCHTLITGKRDKNELSPLDGPGGSNDSDMDDTNLKLPAQSKGERYDKKQNGGSQINFGSKSSTNYSKRKNSVTIDNGSYESDSSSSLPSSTFFHNDKFRRSNEGLRMSATTSSRSKTNNLTNNDDNGVRSKQRSLVNLGNESDSDGSYLMSPSLFQKQRAQRAATSENGTNNNHASIPPALPERNETNQDLQTPTHLDLLTPASRMISSSTPGRSRKQIRTPTIPNVNRIGGKLYPDLRNQFIFALITHAKVTRRAIHERGVLDACIRAIIILSVHPFPIRTAQAAAHLKGIGNELEVVLRESEKACKDKPYFPPNGKFSSVAASCLVSLLEHEQSNRSEKVVPRCTMEALIGRINQLTHHKGKMPVFPKETSYYLDKKNLDPGWMQIRKLCSSNINAGIEQMIKERKNKKLCASGVTFELLDEGKELATSLQKVVRKGIVEPGPLRQLASFTVDEDYGNVTMSMDFREGGGGSRSLHGMCDLLDDHRLPYVVRDLKISDYVFFVGNKLAPILIERKTAEDVAASLADGRWRRQQHSMRKAQYVLGGGSGRKCQICYLIEGDASRRTVHGGRVGRMAWNQSLEDVEAAIAELPSLGFSVMKSMSKMGSMNILAEVARDVNWRSKNGSIDCTHTYEEFVSAVKRSDDKEGDPPTEEEHMNPAPPVVEGTATAGQSTARALESAFTDEPMANTRATAEEEAAPSEREQELKKLSLATLKQLCKERDEKVTGSKSDLIQRMLKPRKPEIILARKRQGQYVPKVPSANAAIMVALLLNHRQGSEGLEKSKIMMLADELGISKDPMGGNGGWYDGWSSIKDTLSGDPPLVFVKKKKYSLTVHPAGRAGVDVAKAIHVMAHNEGTCKCGATHIMANTDTDVL